MRFSFLILYFLVFLIFLGIGLSGEISTREDVLAGLVHLQQTEDNHEKIRIGRELCDYFGKDEDDPLLLEIYTEIAGGYYDIGDLVHAEEFVDLVIQLAERSKIENETICWTFIKRGIIFERQQRPQSEIQSLYEHVFKLAHDNNYDRALSWTVEKLMKLYSRSGEWERAIQFGQDLLDDESITAPDNQFRLLNTMGLTCIRMKDFDRAEIYLTQAIALQDQLSEKATAFNALYNMVYLFSHTGESSRQLEAMKEAQGFSEQVDHVVYFVKIANAYSDFYQGRGNFDQARDYAVEALDKAQESKKTDTDEYWIAYANYGICCTRLGEIDLGIQYIKQSIDFFSNNKDQALLLELYQSLADAYAAAAQYRDALDAFRKHHDLDSLLGERERQEQLTLLQEQFDAQKRQVEITLLTKENELKQGQLQSRNLQMLFMLLSVLVVIIVILFVFARYKVFQKLTRELRTSNEKLNELATRDALTGLHNRRFFYEMMQSTSAYVLRKRQADKEQYDLHFFLLDIDHFKKVNDAYGHDVGDQVLKSVAEQLKNSLRKSDHIVRWGGEEFMILTQGQDRESVVSLAERLMNSSSNIHLVSPDKRTVDMSLSLGICRFPFTDSPPEGHSWEDSVALADAALYHAKATGRNRGCLLKAVNDGLSKDDLKTIQIDIHQAETDGLISISTFT